MGKHLSSDRHFADIVALDVSSHFPMRHPMFNFDVLNELLITALADPTQAHNQQLAAFTLPHVVADGEILSVLIRLPQHETLDHLLAYMRARGKGNPLSYLQQYDWGETKRTLYRSLEGLLKKLHGRLAEMSRQANNKQYTYLSKDIIDGHAKAIERYTQALLDTLTGVFNALQDKANTLLADKANVSVTSSPDSQYPASGGSIRAVVNTAQTIDLSEQKWLKVRLHYDDPWKTPVYASNLTIKANGSVHADKLALQALPDRSSVSITKEHAQETEKVQGGVLTVTDLPPNTDTVTVEFNSEAGLEKQIQSSRNMIEARLDSVYVQVSEAMDPFLKEWKDRGLSCLADGVEDGIVDWGNDFADMFTPKFWSSLGDSIWEVGTSTFDTGVIYAKDFIDSVEKSVDKQVKAGRSWYLANTDTAPSDLSLAQAVDLFGKAASDAEESVGKNLHDNGERLKQKLTEFYHEVDNAVDRARLIGKYHKDILALPSEIAANNAPAIQHFIDTALMEIAPDWAKEIKQSQALPKAMALMRDPSAALTYSAYVMMILDAIPPNFYTYYGGKLGIYILLEVILEVIIGFFTLGAAAEARFALLMAKLAQKARKVKTIEGAEKAYHAFCDGLKELGRILGDLEALANKLIKRPERKIEGHPDTTLSQEIESKKRHGKCRCCHSSKHRTPKLFHGELERK